MKPYGLNKLAKPALTSKKTNQHPRWFFIALNCQYYNVI